MYLTLLNYTCKNGWGGKFSVDFTTVLKRYLWASDLEGLIILMTNTKASSLEEAHKSMRGEGAKLLGRWIQSRVTVKDALVVKSGDPHPSHANAREMVLFRIPPSAQLLFTHVVLPPVRYPQIKTLDPLTSYCFNQIAFCSALLSSLALPHWPALLNPLFDVRVSPTYSPHRFLSWTINAERTWAVHFDLCSTQHSKPYLMNVLDEDLPLKLEADIAL